MDAVTEKTTAAQAQGVHGGAIESMFAQVPETTLPCGHVEPAFKVAKYYASKGQDGALTISATAVPCTNISYFEAEKECAAANLPQITETQYLALAFNIFNQAANWKSGVVGEGSLKQGLHMGTVDEAQAGDYVSPEPDEDRWFVLSNGERICDASGNICAWVRDNVQGDERGIVASRFAVDSPSITTAPFPSMEKGMGWRPRPGSDWSGYALVRGGYWDDGGDAGVFRLVGGSPDSRGDLVGIRCTLQE